VPQALRAADTHFKPPSIQLPVVAGKRRVQALREENETITHHTWTQPTAPTEHKRAWHLQPEWAQRVQQHRVSVCHWLSGAPCSCAPLGTACCMSCWREALVKEGGLLLCVDPECSRCRCRRRWAPDVADGTVLRLLCARCGFCALAAHVLAQRCGQAWPAHAINGLEKVDALQACQGPVSH
jgi:hypothetical protein